MIKFFTYGTFRRGECRNDILTKFGSSFIKQTTTAPEYKLFNLGSFPGMIENGDVSVTGELYYITEAALAMFDMIESHPSFFCRKEINLSDGTTAISYLYPHDVDDFRHIESGDWANR